MKKRNGITLVALVVTIIILLLLAAVTIVFVLGENGIFAKANNARVAGRYSQIYDYSELRKQQLFLNSKFGGNLESESDFVDRMKTIGIYKESEDYFDQLIGKIYIGRQKIGNYLYELMLMSSNSDLIEQISKLPDADAPGNEHLKNMTLIIETTVVNQEVEMPISDTTGLEINWDSKNTNNFQSVSGINPKHIYSNVGTYELQIKGVAQPENSFGSPTSYMDTNIIGIKYWGENGFTEISSLGTKLKGAIPLPSRNSFLSVKSFFKTFSNNNNLTEIPETYS